jgi:hypothetical protein
VIQTKLAINKPGDEYEQEADHISEHVMQMPEPKLQRACTCGAGCPKCQTEQPGREHERLQKKRVQASDTGQIVAPPIVHEVLAELGQPLDVATRAFMEPRFGYDFSQVRVHSGAAAEQSAREVNANAYTAGHNMVFGAGRYAPDMHEGLRLLAHELTHVVQQSVSEGFHLDKSDEKRGLSPTISQSLLTQEADAPIMLQRQTDTPDQAQRMKACMEQTGEIIPSVGVLATILRTVELSDTLGPEYEPLKKKIRASVEARRFVCEAGVPAVLALWDTRTVAGELDVQAARKALSEDAAKIYSKNLDTSWLRRRRIVRAETELTDVATWVKSQEMSTQLPRLLLPRMPALQSGNVIAAASELDALIPIFESATKEFTAAASTAFQLRERLDEAKTEAIKAKNPDYMGGPGQALEKAEKIAQKLQQQLEAVHRGIDVGNIIKTSVEVADAVTKLRRSSTSVDSDTIREVRDVVKTLRQEVANGSTQVTDLAGAARRVSFVLRYFAALNAPGFANAPSKGEVNAMRGKIAGIGNDLELLFGASAILPLDFFSELGTQINQQLNQRATMETTLGHDVALVPPRADVLSYFRTLEKKNNNDVIEAYTAYTQAFFQHRIVNRPEDLDVRGLDEIFARPLSLAGLRPLVCSGYAVLGAALLTAAGAKTQEFIVAVRASEEQLRDNRLDDGHAVAVLKRRGETLIVSNDLVVHNPNDAIGPDAVRWEHKNFRLITAKGRTWQEANEALGKKLARP